MKWERFQFGISYGKGDSETIERVWKDREKRRLMLNFWRALAYLARKEALSK